MMTVDKTRGGCVASDLVSQIGAARLDVYRADAGPLTEGELTDALGPSREAVMTTVSVERLATIFVEAADTLVNEFDLFDFPHTFADRAADLVVASAVGLRLADERGRLEFTAASIDDPHLMNSRIVLEQAEGAVARARGVGVDEAFTLIRDFARAGNRRLTDVAHDIVASPGNAARLPGV